MGNTNRIKSYEDRLKEIRVDKNGYVIFGEHDPSYDALEVTDKEKKDFVRKSSTQQYGDFDELCDFKSKMCRLGFRELVDKIVNHRVTGNDIEEIVDAYNWMYSEYDIGFEEFFTITTNISHVMFIIFSDNVENFSMIVDVKENTNENTIFNLF